MRGRAFRIQAKRFGQLSERAVELGLAVINNSERGAGKFVVRRERDRFFQGEFGGLEFSRPEINDAEIRQRIEIIRRLSQHLLINLFGAVIFAFVEILLRLPGKIDNVRGNVRFKYRGDAVTGRNLRRRVGRHRFIGGRRSGRRGRGSSILCECETRFDRTRIVIGHRDNRLSQKRQFVGG